MVVQKGRERMNKIKKWMDEKMIEKMIRAKSVWVKKSEGMGTVEIILIIVCLVGIVIIFKNQITDLVESIFSKITAQTKKVY